MAGGPGLRDGHAPLSRRPVGGALRDDPVGRFDEAAELLAAARRHAPGEAVTRLAEAHWAFARGSRGEAQDTYDAAEDAVTAAPMAFLQPELALLGRRREASSPK